MDIYEPVIAELKAQIEEWQKMIASLELMRSKGTGTITSTATSAAPVSPNSAAVFANDSFFGMSIADAARKYLGTIKRTATARAITDALLDGGLKSAAKSPLENTRSIISRNPAFVFINGEYGLAEWYPGRKAAPKKSTNTANTVSEVAGEITSVEEPSGSNPIEFRRLA